MSREIKALPQVIGENVNLLRGAKTMDQLAAEGRELGMNWSAGSISAIERGNFKPTLEVLVILSECLSSLRSADNEEFEVSVSELMKSSGRIRITEKVLATSEDLLSWFGGNELILLPDPEVTARFREEIGRKMEQLGRLRLPEMKYSEFKDLGPSTPGEVRLAGKADLDVFELKAWANHLWGMSIEDKRDQEAGEGATPQKKGRISRLLMNDVKTAMRESRGDD